jgi:hypothetical protein
MTLSDSEESYSSTRLLLRFFAHLRFHRTIVRSTEHLQSPSENAWIGSE